jgi:hypothetical protein
MSGSRWWTKCPSQLWMVEQCRAAMNRENGDERGIYFLRLDQLLKLLGCSCSLLLKIRVFNQGFLSGEGLHGWRNHLSCQIQHEQRQ